MQNREPSGKNVSMHALLYYISLESLQSPYCVNKKCFNSFCFDWQKHKPLETKLMVFAVPCYQPLHYCRHPNILLDSIIQ